MTTSIEYALMAGASYIDTRRLVNQFPAPEGWAMSNHKSKDSGFEAVTFTKGSEIVISYAGTYGNGGGILTNPDKQADAFLGAGLWSDQLGQAAAYYLEVKASAPEGTIISFTGHSLGGGLASLMAVFFGETAYTFDQAPFKAALLQAQNLKNYLLTREAGIIDATTLNNLLAPLDRYIAAEDPNNLNPIVADTLAVRQTKVWDINVQGELLSTAPWNLLSRIGTPGNTSDISNNTSGVSADDLHAQALLSAYLQSDKTATINGTTHVKESLSQVTFKLTDLLGMIFNKNLFAYETDTDKRNFLDHLVRHEAGVKDLFIADAMVTLTGGTGDDLLTGGTGNDTYQFNLGDGNDLITDFTAGDSLQFGTGISAAEMTVDVTRSADGSAALRIQYGSGDSLTLVGDPEGLSGNAQFSDAGVLTFEQLIARANKPAQQLTGGDGADVIDGGFGDDTILGEAGNDKLYGWAGNDRLDGSQLTGGAQYGDSRVHRSAALGAAANDNSYLERNAA